MFNLVKSIADRITYRLVNMLVAYDKADKTLKNLK